MEVSLAGDTIDVKFSTTHRLYDDVQASGVQGGMM